MEYFIKDAFDPFHDPENPLCPQANNFRNRMKLGLFVAYWLSCCSHRVSVSRSHFQCTCVCVESSRGSFVRIAMVCLLPGVSTISKALTTSFGVMHMLFIACRDATCLSHLLLGQYQTDSGISNRVREMTILGIIAGQILKSKLTVNRTSLNQFLGACCQLNRGLNGLFFAPVTGLQSVLKGSRSNLSSGPNCGTTNRHRLLRQSRNAILQDSVRAVGCKITLASHHANVAAACSSYPQPWTCSGQEM